MAYVFPPDLDRLIREHMAKGRYGSEDELLLKALQALDERDENVAAIQEGWEDFQAGRVRPLADVSNDIRRRFGMVEPS